MSTEVTLAEQMDYARAVTSTERGRQSLLPEAYRDNPANVLIAMGLGQALDLTPSQSLYEIYVVNGRPTPSANLMAGLARKAGHKLRIHGDANECTAVLIRSDDPDEPFKATWTIKQARDAGLTNKDTWKKYPAAMLRARAISEVVRMGASEVMLGMEYSREEMQDLESDRPATPSARPSGLAAVRAAVATEPEPEPEPEQHADAEDAEVVSDGPEALPEATTDLTDKTRGRLFALFAERGIADADEQRRGISHIIGRQIKSRSEMTEADAQAVIDQLTSMAGAK